MSKYTAGPWGLTSDGMTVRSSHTEANDYRSEHVASLDHYRPERESERQASARLIIAAPELLEALEAMTSLCALKYGNLNADVYAEIEKAKTVIAKARGEK